MEYEPESLPGGEPLKAAAQASEDPVLHLSELYGVVSLELADPVKTAVLQLKAVHLMDVPYRLDEVAGKGRLFGSVGLQDPVQVKAHHAHEACVAGFCLSYLVAAHGQPLRRASHQPHLGFAHIIDLSEGFARRPRKRKQQPASRRPSGSCLSFHYTAKTRLLSSRVVINGWFCLVELILLLELLNTAAAIDELLLTSKERMAL